MAQNSDEWELKLEEHVSPHHKAFEANSRDNPSSVKLNRDACRFVRTPRKLSFMKIFISSAILRMGDYGIKERARLAIG